MKRTIVLMTLCLLLVSAIAFGQAQRGTISVTITDSEGGALPGALVTATSDETLTRRTAAADATGEATLVGLDPATNYIITVSLDGFAGARIEGIIVRAGVDSDVAVKLTLAEISEELIVTAETPLVDVSKTQAGQNITLDLTESLPTQRSYQSYLQLVPGVQDTIQVDFEDNPASRSGVNYRDAHREGGDVTYSTDNLYYFDGINVTDRTTGTNGANLNTEVIQEQSVITGAIPAEFIGAPGLISNVVTKSGGNQFSGSVGYYFQNDSLVGDNDHFPNDTFNSADAAITLGGPIVRDKAWFFASYREVDFDRDVIDETGQYLRTPEQNAQQSFAKLTWAITDSGVLSGQYLTDPTDWTGRFDRDIPNSADETRERGGERWSASYNHVWNRASAEVAVTDHTADRKELAKVRDHAAVASFAPGVDFTSAEERLGGSGLDDDNFRATDSVRASLEYLFDTSWGDHSLKFGIVDGTSTLHEDRRTVGDPPATYISLNGKGTVGPIVLCEVVGTGNCGGNPWSTVDFGVSTDEVNGFNEGLSDSQRNTLLGLWDDNGNGALDQDEILNNMTFASTAGNPEGLINYTRDLETKAGVSQKGSEFTHYYVQDGWQWNKLSLNVGFRAEDTTFITDGGDDVGTWDTEIAPRVSISYDLRGDGRSSIGFFYGEYFDAFRDNAIDFAGSLTGREIEEQVYVDALGEWVNFRFPWRHHGSGCLLRTEDRDSRDRRDPVAVQAAISAATMMFEVNLIDRETTGIGEDYGSRSTTVQEEYGGRPQRSELVLPRAAVLRLLDSVDDIPTNLNFLIGTLPRWQLP